MSTSATDSFSTAARATAFSRSVGVSRIGISSNFFLIVFSIQSEAPLPFFDRTIAFSFFVLLYSRTYEKTISTYIITRNKDTREIHSISVLNCKRATSSHTYIPQLEDSGDPNQNYTQAISHEGTCPSLRLWRECHASVAACACGHWIECV
jgi:hypothetical protein